MIELLWCNFQQCLRTFTICLSKGWLERDFLDIYITTFSESIISEIQNLWRSSVSPKCSKFNLNFQNAAKNWEKGFHFWDNCIWFGIVKFCLLIPGYLSPAANVLRSSRKIWHVNNRDFFELNSLSSSQ